MGVLRPVPSLNQMAMCILSPGRDGVMSQGILATLPCTASTSNTALAVTTQKKKLINLIIKTTPLRLRVFLLSLCPEILHQVKLQQPEMNIFHHRLDADNYLKRQGEI